jgi:hypothetical protein
MNKRLSIIAALALCAGLAVSTAQAGKNPPLAAVPLIVTVHDDPTTASSPYNLRSDGRGAYQNGVDGVAVTLESDGNFVIRATGTRQFYYEYDEPLAGTLPEGYGVPADPLTAILPDQAGAAAPHAVLASGNAFITLKTGTVAIQNMTVGSSQCIRIAANYADSGTVRYRQTYQRTSGSGLADPQVDNTAWGIVTRVDANTWTVESGVGSCPPVVLDAPGAARVIRLEDLSRNRTLTTNLGRFNLPFKMTLTRQ